MGTFERELSGFGGFQEVVWGVLLNLFEREVAFLLSCFVGLLGFWWVVGLLKLTFTQLLF